MLGALGRKPRSSPYFVNRSNKKHGPDRRSDPLVSPLTADEYATPSATGRLAEDPTGSSTVDSCEEVETEYADLGSINARLSATEVTRAEFEKLAMAQERIAVMLEQFLSNQNDSHEQETSTPTPTKGVQSLTSRRDDKTKDKGRSASAAKRDPSDEDPSSENSSSEDSSEEENKRAHREKGRRRSVGGRMTQTVDKKEGGQDISRLTVAKVVDFTVQYGRLPEKFQLDDLVRMDMDRKRYQEEYGINTLWDSIVKSDMRGAIQARASFSNSTQVGGRPMMVCYPHRLSNAGFLRALYQIIAPRSAAAYHKTLKEATRWKKDLPSSVSIANWPSFHCQLVEHVLHFNMCFAWLRRDFEAEERKAQRSRSGKDPKMVILDGPGPFELPFQRQKDGSVSIGSVPRAEQHHCASLLSVFFASIPKGPVYKENTEVATFDILLMIHNQLKFVDRRTPKKERMKGDVVLQDIHWPQYADMVINWMCDFKDTLEKLQDPLTVLTTFNTQLRELHRPEPKAASLTKRRINVVAALEHADDEDEALVAALQASQRADCKHRYCPQMKSKDTCEYGDKCIFSHDISILRQELDRDRRHLERRESKGGARSQPTMENSRFNKGVTIAKRPAIAAALEELGGNDEENDDASDSEESLDLIGTRE